MLSIFVFYPLLGKLEGVADWVIAIKDLIIEELWKLHSSLVQDGFFLVDANDVGNPCFLEHFSNLLRVTTCYVHKLEMGHYVAIFAIWVARGMLNLFKYLLEVRSKEELWGATLVFKNEHVSLVFVFGPCFAVIVIKLLCVLKSMTWKVKTNGILS